jgi:hypothetical protein
MEKFTAQPSRFRVWTHVLGWMIFFLAPVILSPGRDIQAYFSQPQIIFSLVIRNFLLMGLFYVNFFYLTPKIFDSKRPAVFIVSIVLLVAAVSISNFFLHEIITGPFDERHEPPPPDHFGAGADHRGPGKRPIRLMFASPFFSSMLITTLVTVASSLLVLWNNWEKAKANERERTLQKIAAELSVLKLQISPHFLFNTLNNIRWLVRSGSENAEPALVKLSQLLRYILYQANNDKVPLEKETEHLRDYISLQKMRIKDHDSIRFEVTGKTEGRSIVPLLLIPILENFFKHGEFSEETTGLISMVIQGNMLIFRTVNRVSPKSTVKDLTESGIGLENVKKRLALHYPGHHTFGYYEENSYYFVNLEIEMI